MKPFGAFLILIPGLLAANLTEKVDQLAQEVEPKVIRWRHDIHHIPDEVVMTGTIRTFDHEIRSAYHEKVTRTAQKIAESWGATAEVYIGADTGYGPTVNDENLTAAMTPTLKQVAGADRLFKSTLTTGAEDFSFFQKEIPGMFFFLGVTPPDQDYKSAATNHSPLFMIDDDAMLTGIRAMSHLAIDYMVQNQ